MQFNIDFYTERITKLTPPRYFKRNVPEYEFSSYISHILSLSKGQQFNIVIIFVKRCLRYLETSNHKEIETAYLNECLTLFEDLYDFVKISGIIDTKKLSSFNFHQRIQQQKRILKS